MAALHSGGSRSKRLWTAKPPTPHRPRLQARTTSARATVRDIASLLSLLAPARTGPLLQASYASIRASSILAYLTGHVQCFGSGVPLLSDRLRRLAATSIEGQRPLQERALAPDSVAARRQRHSRLDDERSDWLPSHPARKACRASRRAARVSQSVASRRGRPHRESREAPASTSPIYRTRVSSALPAQDKDEQQRESRRQDPD